MAGEKNKAGGILNEMLKSGTLTGPFDSKKMRAMAAAFKKSRKNKYEDVGPGDLDEGQDIYASGGKIPESNATERSDTYQVGGLVDPINPMNLNRPISPEGNTPMSWHGERQWHGGTKPTNEPKQELVWKKGGKVKKK